MEIVGDEQYRCAGRKFHPEDTVVEVGGVRFGGGSFTLIAGPCAVENEAQICTIAERVKAHGAVMLRGGAFKPRTSPYAFQGMGAAGLELLLKAGNRAGLPIVSEITDAAQLPLFEKVDVLQVGARNMQNFALLKCLGRTDKPILLKRGFSATLEELLLSAEYIMSEGNGRVILCERGIRTFEPCTRGTLDILAVPVLKKLTHLPVIVDPSHAAGAADLVEPMCLAAMAAGADGLLVEVHDEPQNALCDGQQSVTSEAFRRISRKIKLMQTALKQTEGGDA